MKICSKCLVLLPFSSFYLRKTGSAVSTCKECTKLLMKHKYKSNPSIGRARTRKYHSSHREERLAYNKQYHKNKASLVLEAYGNKCICCGENNLLFLTIDHINNDGASQRKEIGEGITFYNWVIKNNFPTFLQCLCFNCNCGRYRNKGVCPHKEGKDAI